MRIVSRAEWGARSPKGLHRIATPTPRLWVHHTATAQHGAAGVRAIQRYHMDSRGWLDIAYSFLIDDDGTIYEGRGAGVAGAHTAGDNSTSHAACLMGNFENRAPTKAAVTALVELARHGRDKGWWQPTLGGHRDAPGASTACPGRHLYAALPAIRSRVASPPPAATPPQPSGDDPMALPVIVRLDDKPEWWLYDGFTRKHVLHMDEANLLVFLGLAAPLNDSGQAHHLTGKQAQAVRSAEIIREEASGRIDVDLDPEAIAAEIMEVLPPELAQEVVAEIGVKLSKAET